MNRVYNFSPGPAALPLEVLQQAQQELAAFGNYGMSLMEMSHRHPAVEQIMEQAQALLLELLELPAGYRVLFMGGGASAQFALVPMNFLTDGKTAHYVLSGSFAEKAYKEALAIGSANVIASSKHQDWRSLPLIPAIADRAAAADSLASLHAADPAAEKDAAAGIAAAADTSAAAYVHLTTNNTIEGSQLTQIPDCGAVPLIGDMTSDILGRRRDFSKFALFYAAAQKNLGPAGATVVVIREQLLEQCNKRIPAIFNYQTYAQHHSLYNTPPVHTIYMIKLMLEWTKQQGGVGELDRRNSCKAGLLYDVIDHSGGFYHGVIEQPDRSMMNVTWRMQSEELEQRFVLASERSGFVGLAGHRSVGGLRASVYNAVSVEACQALADFMIDFQRQNG